MAVKSWTIWALNVSVALSAIGCASEVAEGEDDGVGESESAYTGVTGGIRVINPRDNNSSYASTVEGALGSWGNWFCMVGSAAKTRAVNDQFVAKQKATPKGTTVYWAVYGTYVSGSDKCVKSYSVDFGATKRYPSIINVDYRNRPLNGYILGTFVGTKP